MRRVPSSSCVFGGLLLASLAGVPALGCNFEPLSSDHTEVNACRVQAECGSDAECRNGMCMARSTVMPLTIALEVTPRRMPTANEALPYLFKPRMVNGPIDEKFPVPAVVAQSGMIREGGILLPAALSFTPIATFPGISVKSVTASTAGALRNKDADYTVQLFEGVEYRMLVRPTDPQRPPFRRTFYAEQDVPVNLEYGDLPKNERTFAISGIPTGAEASISAFDRVTGDPVSSTASVASGKARLSFSPDAERFRLEIRLSAGSQASKSGDSSCDSGAPSFPAFNILEDQLATDPANGVVLISLPEITPRIRYEGTVALCDTSGIDPRQLGNLPIALRSTKLRMEQMLATGVTASYNATTNAIYDTDAQAFRFCVEVMAGEYDVVVTPPSSLQCALFAEHRVIQPPADEFNASGSELALPQPMFVTGALQTVEAAPLKGASIDGIALGRSARTDVVEGPVTRFNRSQQVTSDAQGSFKLPVDMGSYDVVIKPPTGSGFPWQVRYDVEINRSMEDQLLPDRINMVSPVALAGTLQSSGRAGDVSLDGATIEAYALVSDGLDGRRAISIGKAISGADRHFQLLLPPSTQMHWGAE